MELIYANANKEDIGVLLTYELDLSYGEDENDFELTLDLNSHCLDSGYFIYMNENTEFGGLINGINPDTGDQEVKYTGRTWHGILDDHVIEPTSGSDYLLLSGEANNVIGQIITLLGLNSLFEASSASTGITYTNYQMTRYVQGYQGLFAMLKSKSLCPKFEYNGSKVIISAIPITDWTENEEWDSSQMTVSILKQAPINHLICLGSGELKNRTIVNLYLDNDNNITTTQYYTGLAERTEVLDYANAESTEELTKSGIDKLQDYIEDSNSVSIDFNSNQDYMIGDIVGIRENITGIYTEVSITKCILKVKNNETTLSYEVG